tara:strand:- start:49 stop:942 length:894 start_codon:yes stop_codon:yes gene_type:complete
MLATNILYGQGLGNQLYCYVSTRCIAADRGYDFCINNPEGALGDPRFNSEGVYWMDLDKGVPFDNKIERVYEEKCIRLHLNTNWHDANIGCDIRGTDWDMKNIEDDTIIMGIMQSEDYFGHHKEEIKKWLKVKEEHDTHEYTKDNLCIMNFRGGEYMNSPTLVSKRYWEKAMDNMRQVRSDMEFMVVTDDVASAKTFFPDLPCHHFDVGKDYAVIKNAKHVILSNSTFAFFPVFTSDTIENIVAPKYWARHEQSDGYWATEQNLYKDWMWQDRDGNLQTYDECKLELETYKKEVLNV